MKNLFILISLILFISFSKAHATRSIYVDDFASILGDTSAENTLLSYAQANNIETLLLYELHLVHNTYNLTNATTNTVLANFISKAKTSYGIINVGATSENGNTFTNVIDVYNNSRNNANEKFDIYNLEFEFWNDNSTNPGEIYCTSYLTPNGLACSNDGAFEFFMSSLQIMNDLAANNSHPITVETYIGWPTTVQMNQIATNVDTLRLHAYVSDPNSAFSYSENRIIDIANSNPDLNVSILFSSEPVFMQSWLLENTMTEAEGIFISDWENESSSWTNNINIEGFTYFAYTFNTDINTLSVSSIDDQNISEENILYPNPVENTINIANSNNLMNTAVYNNLGQFLFETKEKEIDVSTLPKGVYFLKLLNNEGSLVKKILKN